VSPTVLVLGAGSIGRRHAANLLELGADVTLFDPDADRAASVPGVRPAVGDLDALPPFEGVVVASPTSLHADQAAWALPRSGSVLVEKPLVATEDEAAPLLHGLDQVMVGYNLRLVDGVRRFVELVHGGRLGHPLSYRLWFGSWLPDWRPAVDYRGTYSAQHRLGGGILLDAIHELDLLVWLAGDGDFEVAGAVVDRVGPLEIDCEDTVRAVLRHRSGTPAEVSLDYLARRYRRGIEVIGTEATGRLDWCSASIAVATAAGEDRTEVSLDPAAAYREEAARFLAFVSGTRPPPVGGAEGLASVVLADRIRAAAL